MRLKPVVILGICWFFAANLCQKSYSRHMFQPGGFFKFSRNLMQKFFKGNFGKNVRHLGFGEWFLLRVASSFDKECDGISDLLEPLGATSVGKLRCCKGFTTNLPMVSWPPPKSTGCEEVTKRSRLEKTLHLHVDARRQMFHWKKKNVSGMRQTCDPTKIIAVFFCGTSI